MELISSISFLNKKFKKTNNHSSSGYVFYEHGLASFGLYMSPFYNCQNFTLANCESFLLIFKDVSLKDTINFLLSETSRTLMLVDIREEMYQRVIEKFKDVKILLDFPYGSTNGNPMRLLYFKLNPL